VAPLRLCAGTLVFSSHRTHKMRTIVIHDPDVCQSVSLSRGRDVQKRLNGSTSCLGWRLPHKATQAILYERGRGFDATVDKLLWPLVKVTDATLDFACSENGSESDVTTSTCDAMRRCSGHVTGSSQRTTSWLLGVCCLLLTLAVERPVQAVEHRTQWYLPPRLNVKVDPRNSDLAPARSVTIQCSVRSVRHVHHSRLRVGFYVSTMHVSSVHPCQNDPPPPLCFVIIFVTAGDFSAKINTRFQRTCLIYIHRVS